MSDAEGTSVDRIARELASGKVSRRSALRRLGGAAIAAVVPGALLAEPAFGRRKRCPNSRRCGDKCCPRHSTCKHGRCKCDEGYTKCGRKCADLQTSVKHCGECGNTCGEAEACVAGKCSSGATCGNGQVEPGEECDGNDHGGATCITLGYAGGNLACTSTCEFDTTGCTGTPCGCGSQCDVSDGCGGTCPCPDPMVCIDHQCELIIPP